MADVKVTIGADSSEFHRTMSKVQKEIGGLKIGLGGLAGLGGGLLAINKAMDGLGMAVGRVSEFMKESVSQAAKMETLQVNFEVLTGSAQKAAEMIAAFRKEEQKSPLNTEDYAEAGKVLMSFGTAADDVMPVLKMLGDVSMGNSARFGQLSLAFAQTTAAGRLMGQEVLQFVNAGFNPLQQISKRTGETMLQLKKRMEDGGVSAQEVRQAFKDATSEGGRFFMAIERGAETFDGKMAQMRGAWQKAQADFGQGLSLGLKPLLDKITEQLPMLTSKFQEVGSIMGNMIKLGVEGNMQGFDEVGRIIGEAIRSGIGEPLLRIRDDIVDAAAGATGDLAGLVLGPAFSKSIESLTGASMGDALMREAATQSQMGRAGRDTGKGFLGTLKQGYQGLAQQYSTRPATAPAVAEQTSTPSSSASAYSPTELANINKGLQKIVQIIGGQPMPN